MDEALPVCRVDALAERGDAVAFEVLYLRQPMRAFALRIDGMPVAYLNRCLHVPVEMDWQPGRFLDSAQEFIICSIHGASYEPKRGRCVGGPCGRGSLTPVRVADHGEHVYWYPSRDLQPVQRVPPLLPADSAAGPESEP